MVIFLKRQINTVLPVLLFTCPKDSGFFFQIYKKYFKKLFNDDILKIFDYILKVDYFQCPIPLKMAG